MSAALALFFAATSLNAQDTNTSDINKDSFIELKARVQTRIMTGMVDSDYALNKDFDAIDFNFRRLRFGIKAQSEKWYGGALELKAENLLATNKAGIQEANIWLKPGFLESKLTLGQFKIPFLREQMASSGKLMIPERGYSAELIQQQDIGLMFAFNPIAAFGENWKKRSYLALSITNGDGSGQDGVGRKATEVVNGPYLAPLINWRFQINALGKEPGEGKEIYKDDLSLSLGYGGAYTEGSEYGVFPAGTDYLGNTVDLTFSGFGIYLSGAYTMFSGASVADQFSTMQTTLGYVAKIDKIYLMPAVRYQFMQSDANGDGAIGQGENISDIWVGANLFANKDKLKAQLFYRLTMDTTGAGKTDALKDDVLYFQLQTDFGKKIY